MKVAILAGGRGSRLAEETEIRPKPMVEIGGRPILWHIMKHYSHFGFNEFVVALGYKGDCIRRYFAKDLTATGGNGLDLGSGGAKFDDGNSSERWVVDLVDTGLATNTGGRLSRLGSRLVGGTFMLTHGDGVSDVDLAELLDFHRAHGRLATVTAVPPPPRFGRLGLDGDRVVDFSEKPQEAGWINGAFFVLEPQVVAYIDGDEVPLEGEPLQRLAADGQLMAFRHEGFWQCMDTQYEKTRLERLWNSGSPPWRIWD